MTVIFNVYQSNGSVLLGENKYLEDHSDNWTGCVMASLEYSDEMCTPRYSRPDTMHDNITSFTFNFLDCFDPLCANTKYIPPPLFYKYCGLVVVVHVT